MTKPGIAACLLALTLAAPAGASTTQESLLQDDNRLLHRGPAVSDRTLRELRDLGVDRVRVSVHWRAIAPGHRESRRPSTLRDPSDPRGYAPEAFDHLDHVVRAARDVGIDVLFNVTGGAPRWATGSRRSGRVNLQYRPDPRRFDDFVAMLGRRYDGTWRDENQGRQRIPRVSAWSIWNEPNLGALLQPQWERDRRGRWRPAAPRIYRALARAAIAGLHRSGHEGDTILLGETAPRGVDRSGPKASLRPGLFLARVLCLDEYSLRPLRGGRAAAEGCDFGRRGPLQVTGYGHHPYSITSPPATPDDHPLNITLADSHRLGALLDAGAAARRLPPALPFWYTEYGWQTRPPDPIRGVRLGDQARWIAEAERSTRDDPRVAAHAQFLLRDDVPRRRERRGSRRYWGTYQSGLEFADGDRKPAYGAYRLPFLVEPETVPPGAAVRLWGLVRPAGDRATEIDVQFRPDGGTWRSVRRVTLSDPRAAFQVDVLPPASGSWRFVWQGMVSRSVTARVG